MYPERKWRKLEEDEKNEIRQEISLLIEEGDYDNPELAGEINDKLAKKFRCSTSQIAGVKAALNRSTNAE